MRAGQARDLFRDLTQRYFAGADVIFSHQSRVAKPKIPLVVITPGNVNRPTAPNYIVVDGVYVGHYLSRFSIQVDLFTHGRDVLDDATGVVIGRENTAVEDMLAFADFLNSMYTVEWCDLHDVSILIEGDVLNLTGAVNDNNYEFRSRLTVQFYFTQKTVEHTAVLDEESVKPDGMFVPVFERTSSGGGSYELAQGETGYFTEVEIKEETGNE